MLLHLIVIYAPEVAYLSGVSVVETPCNGEVTLAAGNQLWRYLHRGSRQNVLSQDWLYPSVDFLDLRE